MTDILARDPVKALRAVLVQDAPCPQIGDGFGNGGMPVLAAVLVPLIMRHDGPQVLFTRRTEHLAQHIGQVSFPGGRREASDATPIATALRETQEETGIMPEYVRVAGYLPRHITGTGFDITPVVGVLRDGFVLAPDPHEVAEIFDVPLPFLLDRANLGEETREWDGKPRRFSVYRPGPHYIWGATAAIMAALATRLRGENGMRS